jgi:uncharacterized membrane protein HdeD (DUF308 family)
LKEEKVANAKPTLAEEVLLPARKHWALLLTLGILMVILGTIGLVQPVAYTRATTIFFGALLLVSGRWDCNGIRSKELEG